MYPHAAVNMPYDIGTPLIPPGMPTPPELIGAPSPVSTVTLTTPGLYVFFCDIHPYMFAAVIVDDPATKTGFDLGATVDLPHVTAGGLADLATTSDLVLRLVHTFFIATNPNNWQSYPVSGPDTTWQPSYPGVPVLAGATLVPNLDDFLCGHFGECQRDKNGTIVPHVYLKTLSAPNMAGKTPGVGQVWVDTQFEMMHEKTKPGTATAVNATNWTVERKVGLPTHGTYSNDGMNNPHNMWTDKDQTVIYQTEWFDNSLSVFNISDGKFVRRIDVGPAPAHVMTRTLDDIGNISDQVHVSQNGGNNIRELEPLVGFKTTSNGLIRDIPMSTIAGSSVHPHAHWMSADGKLMVTPNEDNATSTLFDFKNFSIYATTPVGHSPIATGMMPDSSKYYVANFLDSTISVIGLTGYPSAPIQGLITTINLIANYDAVTGAITGPVGALPIQTPVSPDGRFMVTANTLTGTITIVNTWPNTPTTDTVVKMLTCDPGCHGVQWGAKAGGGYYAYVSSKFSNRMLVVDPDPNGALHHDGSDAVIAGQVLLTATGATAMDGTVSDPKFAGMGGQGVLPIPVVYNGWVQHLPEEWQEKLTRKQLHPIGDQGICDNK